MSIDDTRRRIAASERLKLSRTLGLPRAGLLVLRGAGALSDAICDAARAVSHE
jgi:hypothetical protein